MSDLKAIERDEAAVQAIQDGFIGDPDRLVERLPLYVAYFRAVEARDRQPFDCTKAADELYAARKALLEDSDGRA